jgi:chromosome partitioning protein
VALALSEAGVLALPYIVLRNDHMDSLAAGLAVSEFSPGSTAAAEIRALWAWSKQKIAVHRCAQCVARLCSDPNGPSILPITAFVTCGRAGPAGISSKA